MRLNESPPRHNNIHTGEYKYQIGCQVDYDPNKPETPMLVMELERVVRNLPQTLTGETPKAMPTRTQVHIIALGGPGRRLLALCLILEENHTN